MAGFSLTLKLTHLTLVLLVVITVSAFSDQDAATHTIKGYVRDPLKPRPNGTSPIAETFYITKTQDPCSDTVAVWELFLVPLPGYNESNRALVNGEITQKRESRGNGDYGTEMLQPILAEGVMNSSNQVDRLVVAAAGTQHANGTVSLFRFDGMLELTVHVSVRYGP